MGIACYLAGFSVTAVLLDLTDRDVIVGLIAGAVCGITMLVVTVGGSFELRPALRKRLFPFAR
jgi:hypothetical protein